MRSLRVVLLVLFSLGVAAGVSGQSIEGVILSVEDGKVYVDLKKEQVKVGDVLKVLKSGGFMVHPVTGEKIRKNDEIIANISLTQVNDTYSVGEVYPKTAIDLIKPGLKVYTLASTEVDHSLIKKAIIIPLISNNLKKD